MASERADSDDDSEVATGVDIKAVLAAVVDRPPPPDLSDRVMSRLALVETFTDFAALIGLVPAEAASEMMHDGEPPPTEEEPES